MNCNNNCPNNLEINEVKSAKEYLNISNLDDVHICKIGVTETILRATYRNEEELKALFKVWNGTWRVYRTYAKDMAAGVKNLFYKEYNCQHSNRRVSLNTLNPHKKHCDCPATMTITIKRVAKKRCRAKDPHLPQFPTIIKIINQHNHSLDSADALKYKDVSEETKNVFASLYENGVILHTLR